MKTLLTRYQDKYPQIGLAILLGFVLFVEYIIAILSSILNIQQSPVIPFLFGISVSAILTLWVHYDSLSSGMLLGIDQPMFIFLGWPLMFPVYVFRSRGFRSGSLLLLSFLGVFIFPIIAALIVSFVIGTGILILSA